MFEEQDERGIKSDRPGGFAKVKYPRPRPPSSKTVAVRQQGPDGRGQQSEGWEAEYPSQVSIWKVVGSLPGDPNEADLSSKSPWKAEERRTERKLLELPAVHYALGGSTEAPKFFLTA